MLLGFSSGLPYALVASTLALWYTDAGSSLLVIGFLTLIGQPYTYKFMWAPFLDRFTLFNLSRRRGWILICQIGLIILIALMSCLSPSHEPLLLASIALGVAFLSATQDIAINAYQTEIAPPSMRALIAGAYVTGYRIGMIVSGAFAIIIAQEFNWHIAYFSMALLMLIGLLTTILSNEETAHTKCTSDSINFKKLFAEPFLDFIRQRGGRLTTLLLVTMISYKLCDAFALSLNSTFLFRHMHFTLEQIATANKLVGILATIVGCIIGGYVMTRIGLYKGLLYFGILQTGSNLAYMALAYYGHHLGLLLFCVFAENFCSGLGTAAFVAWIMAICQIKHTATQFALLTAFTAFGRVYVGPVAAILVEHLGWLWFFGFSTVIGIPAILLVKYLKPMILLDETRNHSGSIQT